MLLKDGRELVFHSDPFDEAVEISGFFRLEAWIGIDQPDTDFQVRIFEIDTFGRSILLTTDLLRARHRRSLRRSDLVESPEPELYVFDRFMFISRRLEANSRIRLVIGPINSIHQQKTFNSDKPVAEQTLSDARTVTVKLWHDENRLSVLHVPIGRA